MLQVQLMSLYYINVEAITILHLPRCILYTGFSFSFFPDILAILILLSSKNNYTKISVCISDGSNNRNRG